MLAYLKVLFPMEDNRFSLHFAIFDVHLVPTQYYRNVLTHTHQVTMPVWYILVSHSRGDIKHDDGTLALNVIAISKPSKFFLASCVPYIELNWPLSSIEN